MEGRLTLFITSIVSSLWRGGRSSDHEALSGPSDGLGLDSEFLDDLAGHSAWSEREGGRGVSVTCPPALTTN
jgi:hypothetical protein